MLIIFYFEGDKLSLLLMMLKAEMPRPLSMVLILPEINSALWSENGKLSLRPELTARLTTVILLESSLSLLPRDLTTRKFLKLPPMQNPLKWELSVLKSIPSLPMKLLSSTLVNSQRNSLVKTTTRRLSKIPARFSPFNQLPLEKWRFSRDPNLMVIIINYLN